MNNAYNQSQVIHGSKTEDNRTNTTNHIYLHPNLQSDEYESWMRKIGGLLQIDSEIKHLKPLLDLLVAVTEPERMFLHTLPAIDSHQLKSCHEIRLVFRKERIEKVSSLEGFIKLASSKQKNVMIILQSNTEYEENSQDCCNGNVLCFREEFLVFSNSPYKIKEYTNEQIKNSYDKVLRIFNKNYEEAISAFQCCKALFENKDFYQAYWIVVRTIEQIYNAIIDPFANSLQFGMDLSQLKRKAAQHLPQLFYSDYKLIEIEELSLQLVNQYRFGSDSSFARYNHILEIAQEFISAVKPCFESKINYLVGNELNRSYEKC